MNENLMEQKKSDILLKDSSYLLINGLKILLGSLFLSVMARFSIPLPFTPVPFSMQPLAVFILAFLLGSKKAPLAILAYLLEATFGLPVLSGGLSQPLWMLSIKAGYLFGFLIIAYLIPFLLEKQEKVRFYQAWLVFLLAEIVLLSCGTLWLSYFVGLEKAVWFGAIPFLPGALIKISIATCLFKFYKRVCE